VVACRCVGPSIQERVGPSCRRGQAGRSLPGGLPRGERASAAVVGPPPARLEIYSHPPSRTSTYRRVRFGDIESALSPLTVVLCSLGGYPRAALRSLPRPLPFLSLSLSLSLPLALLRLSRRSLGPIIRFPTSACLRARFFRNALWFRY